MSREYKKIDLTITIHDDLIKLELFQSGKRLVWIDLKPHQAQQWADTIDHAVGIWEERMLKDVKG